VAFDLVIPTEKQFKALTGRTGFSKILKTKNDLESVFTVLAKCDPHRNSMSGMHVKYFRAIRAACRAWLEANKTRERKSKPAVEDLLARADNRFLAIMEVLHHHEQKGTNVSEMEAAAQNPQVRSLPFGKDLTGQDVKRVGNQMVLPMESANPLHLGPRVQGTAKNMYSTQYKNRGGKALSLGAWLEHIYPANAADDPTGVFFKMTPTGGDKQYFESKLSGVTYCTPEQRKAYVREIRQGLLYDKVKTPSNNPSEYHTMEMQTHFSGPGWAIYVLGFDN
jgi:hypothetical protein